jgi:hypothetical protein
VDGHHTFGQTDKCVNGKTSSSSDSAVINATVCQLGPVVVVDIDLTRTLTPGKTQWHNT